MNPQAQDALQRYTMAAKAIIYDAQRMKEFLKMMGSPEGAVSAVHTVVVAIEQTKPIPPEIAILVAINVYVVMVDMAQQATGMKGDPGIMQAVMGMLAKGMASGPQQGDQPEMQPGAQPPQQPQPGGLIASNQGVQA